MEILRKLFLFAALCLGLAATVHAQSDAAVQKAFSDSYTQEYNKKYDEAIRALTRLNDDTYEVNARLGYLYYVNKNYTQSQTCYQKAISQKPYAIEAKFGIIKTLSALESWDKVLQQYEEILKIDPQNTVANYWAGVIFYNRKKYEQAARYFEKVVNLYPFDYDATHMLAWTYLSLGRNNDAKTLFNKALVIRPGDSSATSGLAKVK